MTVLQEPSPRDDRVVIDRRFEALVFDWDGTAVPDRSADAGGVRRRIERLCELGMDVAVVSGTHLGNIDAQLGARPGGPGTLHLLLNRGSEVYRVGTERAELLHRREASAGEDAALTRAAELTCRRLSEHGLGAEIVSARLNRRKIDLIPEPAWAEPPKARIAELLAAVEERLARHGFGGLSDVVELAEAAAAEAGLAGACVTSDAKHVEIGLTDKADSADWIFAELWRRGVGPGLVLVAGDELGPLGGVRGSDSRLLAPEAALRAAAVSVGVEPEGVPPGVVYLGGGPDAFAALLDGQIRRREAREVPELDGDPAWTLAIDGVDPTLERVHESLLTLADGCVGTAGSPLGRHPAASPLVLAAGVYIGAGPESELVSCPLWNTLPFALGEAPIRRTLDMHAGLLRYEIDTEQGGLLALAFSSAARPGTAALRATGPRAVLRGARSLAAPGERDWRGGRDAGRDWLVAGASRGGVAVAGSQSYSEDSESLDRLAVYCTSAETEPSAAQALARLHDAEQAGYEPLLVEHREAWGAALGFS